MNLKSTMICCICKRILKDPVTLPCHCVVCNEHLHDDSAKNGSIQCLKCDKDFDIPLEGFAPNQLAESYLDKELHLNEEEKALKASLHCLIYQLDKLQSELKLKQANLDRISYDVFSDIRRNIDLRREELKSKIDEISLKMIEHTNALEKLYTTRARAIFPLGNQVDIENSSQKITEAFRLTNIILADVKSMQDGHEQTLGQLESKKAEFDSLRKEIRSLKIKSKQEFQANTCELLKPHGQRVLSCSNDGAGIKLWDLASKKRIKTFEGHSDAVTCLEFIDIYKFASGSKDKTIKIWDVREDKCLITLAGHTFEIVCIRGLNVAANSSKLASGSICDIRIWDVINGACLLSLRGHLNYISDLICLPSKTLVSCSWDDTIKFWNVSQGVCVKTLNHTGEVNCMCLLEDGHLAIGSEDGLIKIWDIERDEGTNILMGHTSTVWRLQCLENGELVSCSDDRTIKIWSVESATCIRTLTGHSSLVRSIRISENNLLISSSWDGTIKTWDLDKGECLQTIDDIEGNHIDDLILI